MIAYRLYSLYILKILLCSNKTVAKQATVIDHRAFPKDCVRIPALDGPSSTWADPRLRPHPQPRSLCALELQPRQQQHPHHLSPPCHLLCASLCTIVAVHWAAVAQSRWHFSNGHRRHSSKAAQQGHNRHTPVAADSTAAGEDGHLGNCWLTTSAPITALPAQTPMWVYLSRQQGNNTTGVAFQPKQQH